VPSLVVIVLMKIPRGGGVKRDGFLLDMRAMPPFSMTRVHLLCFGVARCVRAHDACDSIA